MPILRHLVKTEVERGLQVHHGQDAGGHQTRTRGLYFLIIGSSKWDGYVAL